ncbi:MAG TPA: MFS transporter [Dehalococcoidia bacterium]|nr:MFS transporter [Dehalococcoidia bacterium]
MADTTSGATDSDLPDEEGRGGIRASSSPESTNGASGRPAIESGPTTSPRASASGWRRTFSSLKYREFRFLWLGMLLLMTAMQMQMVVRSYLTYEITSSPFLLGLVNAGFAIPMLSLALFGGAIADRMERKLIIQIGQLVAVVLSLIIGISIATDTVTWMHLLGVSMAQGALFSFLVPARQALIPQLVGKDNLTNAMSLDAAAMSATMLVAPAIGGGLYNVIGPDGVYYLITGCGVLAILFTSAVKTPARDKSRARTAMLGDIKSGLMYVVRSRMVLVLIILGLLTTLLAQPFRFIMPVFVVDVYGKGPESMGLLVTITGVGALIGSLWIASIGKWHRGLLLLGSGLVSGVALLLVASIPVYLAAAGIMILLGLGDAGRQTLNQVMIMEEVDDEYRGRVMSIFMMIWGMMPLGVLPAGLLAEAVSGQFAVGVMATLLILVTFVLWATQKQLRNHM